MKCALCEQEGVFVDMERWETYYGRLIHRGTYFSEPEQEIEFIDWRCPVCFSKYREWTQIYSDFD